jgi:hypothetical protein
MNEVVALQAAAVMDHLAIVPPTQLENLMQGQTGGSRRISRQELSALLANLPEFTSKVSAQFMADNL